VGQQFPGVKVDDDHVAIETRFLFRQSIILVTVWFFKKVQV